jgi:hypothetical protein
MSNVAFSGNASGTGTFTIASPNSNTDRTLDLPDNSGTVVSTGSTAAVTQAMLTTAVIPLGVEQTWQNVIASRAVATTYTNTTGRPIYLQVSTISTGDTTVSVTINGLLIPLGRNSVSGGQPFGSILIPAGATYNVTNSGSLGTWFELR